MARLTSADQLVAALLQRAKTVPAPQPHELAALLGSETQAQEWQDRMASRLGQATLQPDAVYLAGFLERLIQLLEAGSVEVTDSVYESHAEAAALAAAARTDPSSAGGYVTYSLHAPAAPEQAAQVTVWRACNFSNIAQSVWPAAFTLGEAAAWAAGRVSATAFGGRCVVELGAGTGLGALLTVRSLELLQQKQEKQACACAGGAGSVLPRCLVVTDGDEPGTRRAGANLSLNAAGKVQAAQDAAASSDAAAVSTAETRKPQPHAVLGTDGSAGAGAGGGSGAGSQSSAVPAYAAVLRWGRAGTVVMLEESAGTSDEGAKAEAPPAIPVSALPGAFGSDSAPSSSTPLALIGSDLVYDPADVPALVQTIGEALTGQAWLETLARAAAAADPTAVGACDAVLTACRPDLSDPAEVARALLAHPACPPFALIASTQRNPATYAVFVAALAAWRVCTGVVAGEGQETAAAGGAESAAGAASSGSAGEGELPSEGMTSSVLGLDLGFVDVTEVFRAAQPTLPSVQRYSSVWEAAGLAHTQADAPEAASRPAPVAVSGPPEPWDVRLLLIFLQRR